MNGRSLFQPTANRAALARRQWRQARNTCETLGMPDGRRFAVTGLLGVRGILNSLNHSRQLTILIRD